MDGGGEMDTRRWAEGCRDIRNGKLVTVVIRYGDDFPNHAYAAAATTGAAGGASTLGSSGAAGAVSAAASAAGFSRGATGAGSSIFGGFSSTLGGVACSALGLGLKKSPTRDDRRRPTLAFFSSFFSSFYAISQRMVFVSR